MADETKNTSKEPAAESGGGAGWGEFALDKGTDFVLMFTGLYLALWVQDGVDNRKEREAYVESLANFQTEMTHNKAQVVDTKGLEQSIDDLAVLSAYYQLEAQIFSEFERPSQAADVVEMVGEMETLLDEEIAKAQPGASLGDVFERASTLKPVKLSPHYQTQIWNVYLAGGVNIAQKNAKDPQLAREIGALYAELASVEGRVRDIESYYNGEFLPRFSEITAASADVESYWYDDETGEFLEGDALLTKLQQNQPEILEAAVDLDQQLDENYVELQVVSSILQAKVDDVTNPEDGLLVNVSRRIDSINAQIDAERAQF